MMPDANELVGYAVGPEATQDADGYAHGQEQRRNLGHVPLEACDADDQQDDRDQERQQDECRTAYILAGIRG